MINKRQFIVVAEGDNQSILYDWIEKNRSDLVFVSEELGCGCCVSIFDIEGEEKILDTFPKKILE
ncbi:hypothetical protein [Aquimarina pacifica]|uniref:hypothetical protein n=1 Tax=Aquimarina pacifica TaxID=1296415 RepID=UPI00046F41E8|nr:hypothetical protein [Aquimarina pacifica]